MAAYELGKCLPAGQGPLPLDLIRVESSSSAVVPNGGEPQGAGWAVHKPVRPWTAVNPTCTWLVSLRVVLRLVLQAQYSASLLQLAHMLSPGNEALAPGHLCACMPAGQCTVHAGSIARLVGVLQCPSQPG